MVITTLDEYYSASYSSVEMPIVDIITIPSVRLTNARRILSEKGMLLRNFPEVDRWSLQNQDMFNFFRERVSEAPKYKDSVFTPKDDERVPSIRTYNVSVYMFREGTAFFTKLKPEEESPDYIPLVLNSLTESDLVKLIEMCELPVKESLKRVRRSLRID